MLITIQLPKRGEDNGLYVSEGSAVPSVVKSVINITTSDGKTRVGDTLRYKLIASNVSAESSVWKDAKVADTLSEGQGLDKTSVKI